MREANEKKLELNLILQFGEKLKKTPENSVSQKSDISGGFGDFFSELINPIDRPAQTETDQARPILPDHGTQKHDILTTIKSRF